MRTLHPFVISFALLAIGTFTVTAPANAVESTRVFAGLVENRGQIDELVRYYHQGGETSIFFTQDAVILRLEERDEGTERIDRWMSDLPIVKETPTFRNGCAVRIQFEGANPASSIEGKGALPGYYNYFMGNESHQWQKEVPRFSEIIYRDLWPGIDLVYRYEDGRLRYRVMTDRGADLDQVRFGYSGADKIMQDGTATYVIETSVGRITDTRPATESDQGEISWRRVTSAGANQSCSPGDRADNESRLLWSSFLGGSSLDSGLDAVVDATGDVLIAGNTVSTDLPVTPGAFRDSLAGEGDVFVAKLSSDGSTLIWCTYFGGGNDDHTAGIVVDFDLNPLVIGKTKSADLPTTPGAYDTSFNGSEEYPDCFLLKLDANGDSLHWATFFGGTDGDDSQALALDHSGNPLVTGSTWSSQSEDFPVSEGAYDTTFNGGYYDAYLVKFTADGSDLLWGTFLGGDNAEYTTMIAMDPSDNPLVVGATQSHEIGTTPGAYQEDFMGASYDGFVYKLTADGTSAIWCTFLGGNNNDRGAGIALDADSRPVIMEYSSSSDFPTTAGAYRETPIGGLDITVARLSADGSDLEWGTYLGGTAFDWGIGFALNSLGNPVLAGYTESSDFPTTNRAYDRSYGGGTDGFLTELNSTGTALVRSTYLGGGSLEYAFGMALQPNEGPVVVGTTRSHDFPATQGAYDEALGGAQDGFISAFPTSVGYGACFDVLTCECYVVLDEAECSQGGANPKFQGLETTCSRDPEAVLGACCHDSTCVVVRCDECIALTGYGFIGPGSVCDPDPCPLSDVQVQTEAADRVQLLPLTPNPITDDLTYQIVLPRAGRARVHVYDTGGRMVCCLINQELPAGIHNFNCDPANGDGERLPSGVYYMCLVVEGIQETRPFVVIR